LNALIINIYFSMAYIVSDAVQFIKRKRSTEKKAPPIARQGSFTGERKRDLRTSSCTPSGAQTFAHSRL
jgi:hypothetical protein